MGTLDAGTDTSSAGAGTTGEPATTGTTTGGTPTTGPTTGTTGGITTTTGTTGGAATTTGGTTVTTTTGGTTTGGTTGGQAACDAVGDAGLFFPPVNYAIGAGPHAMTTFQDDGGQVGLATANFGDGNVWVLTGVGDGTFIDAGSYSSGPSGPQLETICSADFNGDGLADLAADAWNNSTDDMMLLNGTGAGAFSSANSNVGGSTTFEVITADVNSDSLPDLLLIADQGVVIGLGQGDGGFTWGTPITGLGDPRGLAVSNFDNTGIPQIAVADNSGSQVYVLAPIDGGLTPVGPWAVDEAPIAIAAADFNGDGCEDVVTGNNVADSITVLISSCTPGVAPTATTYHLAFSPPQGGCALAVCGRPQWLVTGDFNCDGNPDVAVAFYDPLTTGENVALFLGNGNGSLQDPLYIQADLGPSDIVTGDFNGDGKPDLAVSNWVSNDVSVFIHR